MDSVKAEKPKGRLSRKMKSTAQKKSIKVFLVFLCATLLLGVFLYTQCYRKVSDPQTLQISHVTVTENDIVVDGANGSAGLFNYLGFDTAYQNGRLTITYYGGWRLPWMAQTNSPAFYPVPNDYPALQEIYLQGSSKTNTRLIWTVQTGEIIEKGII